jgi:fructose-bisphosphate aldolase class II
MFKKAMEGKYAIPAYNFNNMEQLQAIIQGCGKSNSPVILQVSSGARKYANQTLLRYMAEGAVKMAREMGFNIPICLHLDHGDTFELCKSCIETGFSSVMIDGSHHEYDKNVELTRQVVEYAHKYDVTVEGELGVLAGIEDDVKAAEQSTPNRARSRIREEDGRGFPWPSPSGPRTAPSSSSQSSARRTRRRAGPAALRFDILEEIEKRIPASRSSCTVPRPCCRSTWTSSTRTAGS